eukprot:jgi/Chrzof1/11877/Cz06g13080.t1
MDRPVSRGGLSLSTTGMSKAPTGSAIEKPDRPSTASRPSQFAAPATPSGSRPTGTAVRSSMQPPPGTAYKRVGVAAPGTAASRALQVEARPLTQQGISGMKPTTQMTGRQVLDRSYFLSELRQKRQEIINITHNIKEELETAQQKQATFARADKRHKELQKEVKQLQEALADHNMVLDKAGSHSALHLINAEYAAVKQRNDMQRQRVDEMLTQRLAIEQKTKQADTRIGEIQAAADARLGSLTAASRQQYSEHLSEQANLMAEASRFEEGLSELDRQLSRAEGELARNGFKQRALELQEHLKILTERRYELVSEEERSKATPEEQREQLMARIKRDNAEVDRTAATAKELQAEVKKLEAQLPEGSRSAAAGSNTAGNAAPAKDDPARREKYEELVAKERELNAFLDAFPERKASKLAELASRQDAIVAVLERINKLQSVAGGALPTKGQFQDMQEELNYKKQQLESAAATGEALKAELTARRSELEKIDTLSSKIATEMDALRVKMSEVDGDLKKFGNVEDAKVQAARKQSELEALRHDLVARKEAIQADLSDKQWQLKAKDAQLRGHPAWANLDRMEQQLRTLQQSIYSIGEYVRAREAESNYQPLAANLGRLADEVNSLVIAAMPA